MTTFDFKLSLDEAMIREKIDYLMKQDDFSAGYLPWFGRFTAGAHFRSNGKAISGFYQNIDQFQRFGVRRRGTPVRAWFYGKLKKNKDGTTSYKGIIFPDLSSFLLALAVFAAYLFYSSDQGGIMFAAIVLGILVVGFITLEIQLYNYLKTFFT